MLLEGRAFEKLGLDKSIGAKTEFMTEEAEGLGSGSAGKVLEV